MEPIHETMAHRALDRDTAARDRREALSEAARDELAAALLNPKQSATSIVEALLGREGADELLLDALIVGLGVSPDGDTDVKRLIEGALENLLEHGENELLAGFDD